MPVFVWTDVFISPVYVLSMVLQRVTHTHTRCDSKNLRFQIPQKLLHFTFPPAMYEAPMSPILVNTCYYLFLFLTITLVGVKDDLTVVLICISLVAGQETPLAISLFSLDTYLFRSFVSFFLKSVSNSFLCIIKL